MAAAKVPILGLTAESYRFVLGHPRDLARMGWAPLLILLASNVLFGAYAPAPGVADMWGELWRIAANLTIQTVVAASVLVGWHRFVLLGERARPAGGGSISAMGRRELRYLVAWMLLSLLFLALLAVSWGLVLAAIFAAMLVLKLAMLIAGSSGPIPLGGTGQFIVIQLAAIPPAMLLAAYVAIRLSLILPAMAVERDRAMRRAWIMSKGNGWRLVLASFLTLVPAEAVCIGVSFGARAAHDTPMFYPLALGASAMLVFLIVVTGTVLSLFSRDLDVPDAHAGKRAEAAMDPGPSASPA